MSVDPFYRAVAREPAARPLELRALFREHYASLWRLLRRLGVPAADLDDAAQEVFWVAARRLSDIRPASAHSFLYGVALRVAANSRRRSAAARQTHSLDQALPLAAPGLNPEEQLQGKDARALLDAVLGQMTPELRTPFVLFELEGLEIKVIAELEGVPLGTASSRLRRAREEFAELCKRLNAVRNRRRC